MEGGSAQGNTLVGTGCILWIASTKSREPTSWMAICRKQKAKVNKQIFLCLFEQNQITSNKKEEEGRMNILISRCEGQRSRSTQNQILICIGKVYVDIDM